MSWFESLMADRYKENETKIIFEKLRKENEIGTRKKPRDEYLENYLHDRLKNCKSYN